MQVATSLETLNLPLPFSRNLKCQKSTFCSKKRVFKSVYARKRDSSNSDNGHDHDRAKGKLVDENIIVLRLRIQEMKKKEEELQNCAIKSDKWMEWEREWSKNYESDVFEGVGLLQILLMNTRPSLVLGVVALLIFSVSTSLAVTLCSLLDFVINSCTLLAR